MIENVSVFVTVLQVPVARFFSFCVFVHVSTFYSPLFNFTILSSVQFTPLLNHSVRFECLMYLLFVMLHGMWDLNPMTIGELIPCIRSTES